jgi:hypothetical protein
MAGPKSYGTPIGATGGKPINTGRTKAAPAKPAQVSDYLRHMIEADRQHQGSQARPTGNSGGLRGMLAKGNPPVGIGGRRREATITDAVDKAAK